MCHPKLPSLPSLPQRTTRRLCKSPSSSHMLEHSWEYLFVLLEIAIQKLRKSCEDRNLNCCTVPHIEEINGKWRSRLIKIELVLNCMGPRVISRCTCCNSCTVKWMGWIPSKQNLTLIYPLGYADKTGLRGLQEYFLIWLFQVEITRYVSVRHASSSIPFSYISSLM